MHDKSLVHTRKHTYHGQFGCHDNNNDTSINRRRIHSIRFVSIVSTVVGIPITRMDTDVETLAFGEFGNGIRFCVSCIGTGMNWFVASDTPHPKKKLFFFSPSTMENTDENLQQYETVHVINGNTLCLGM